MEIVTDFIFLSSKITADGDCSHEIKRRLLLGRKAVTNLDSILKSRDVTLPTSLYSQSCSFSSGHVQMWELDYKESWAPKKWCFWTMVLENILESPLDWKEIKPVHPKGNQSGIFINIHWCWTWSSNTSATWCEELTHWQRPWCWEWIKAGWEVDDRGWDGWMASPTLWTWVWANSGSWWRTGKPGMLQSMGSQWVTELNWTPYMWASLVAQIVKNLPAMQEIWVQSLGHKDPLEKGMATHSSILAWRIPWKEKLQFLVSYSTWDREESDMIERPISSLSLHIHGSFYPWFNQPADHAVLL